MSDPVRAPVAGQDDRLLACVGGLGRCTSRAKQPGCLSMLIGLGLLLVFGVVLFGGSSAPPDAGPSATPAGSGPPNRRPPNPTGRVAEGARAVGADRRLGTGVRGYAQAKRVLPQLPVKGRAPLTDYSREAFRNPVVGRQRQPLRHPQRHLAQGPYAQGRRGLCGPLRHLTTPTAVNGWCSPEAR